MTKPTESQKSSQRELFKAIESGHLMVATEALKLGADWRRDIDFNLSVGDESAADVLTRKVVSWRSRTAMLFALMAQEDHIDVSSLIEKHINLASLLDMIGKVDNVTLITLLDYWPESFPHWQDLRTADGNTIGHAFVQSTVYGKEKILETILNRGMDIHELNSHGQTMLHEARYPDVALTLMHHGASPLDQNRKRESVFTTLINKIEQQTSPTDGSPSQAFYSAQTLMALFKNTNLVEDPKALLLGRKIDNLLKQFKRAKTKGLQTPLPINEGDLEVFENQLSISASNQKSEKLARIAKRNQKKAKRSTEQAQPSARPKIKF